MKYQLSGQKIVKMPTEPEVVFDFEERLNFYHDFYQSHKVKIPRDYAKIFQDLWQINASQILQAVEQEGYDFLLLGLPVQHVMDIDQQMTGTGNQTKFWFDPEQIKENDMVQSPRLVLMYRDPDLRRHSALNATLGLQAQHFLDKGVATMFSDYRVYNEVVCEQDGVRPETWGCAWLPGSRAGSSVVRVRWNPGYAQVSVDADSPDVSGPTFGCRLSRCFV